MPADLVRRKVEQGPVLVGDVLVVVSEIYLRAIVASHLSHSIVALHWKTTDAERETPVLPFHLLTTGTADTHQ